jgi:hypothetical protein
LKILRRGKPKKPNLGNEYELHVKRVGKVEGVLITSERRISSGSRSVKDEMLGRIIEWHVRKGKCL